MMDSLEQTCVKCGSKKLKHETISGMLCKLCWNKWSDFFDSERNKGCRDSWFELWKRFINSKVWSVS